MPAHAEVFSCVGKNGARIYTDRPCAAIDAVDVLPAATPGSPLNDKLNYSNGCARSFKNLVSSVTIALQNQDPVHLSTVYSWRGMSGTHGYNIAQRLESIATRELLDVIPVYPSPELSMQSTGEVTISGQVSSNALDVPEVRRVKRGPIGIRIVQRANASGAQTSINFGLRQYMGCWWIAL